jgi:hypothetical protein
MDKPLHKLVWEMVVLSAQRQGRTTVQLARIRTARAAVKGVQAARLSAGWAFVCLLLAGLAVTGCLIFHAGLFVLLPWSLEQRAWLMVVLGAVYFLIVVVAAVLLLRDRFWMRFTGTDRLVERALTGQRLLQNERSVSDE